MLGKKFQQSLTRFFLLGMLIPGILSAQDKIYPELEALREEPRLEIGGHRNAFERESQSTDGKTQREDKKVGFLFLGNFLLDTKHGNALFGYSYEVSDKEYEDTTEKVDLKSTWENQMIGFRIPIAGGGGKWEEKPEVFKVKIFFLDRKFIWDGNFKRKANGTEIDFNLEQNLSLETKNLGLGGELFGLSLGQFKGTEITEFRIASANGSIFEHFEYQIRLPFLKYEWPSKKKSGPFFRADILYLTREPVQGNQYETLKSQRSFWEIEFGEKGKKKKIWGWSVGRAYKDFFIKDVYTDDHDETFSKFSWEIEGNISASIGYKRNKVHHQFFIASDFFEERYIENEIELGFIYYYMGEK